MIRLLVTLNVMLVVLLLGYSLLVNTTINTVLRAPIANYYQNLGKGTAKLLNASITGLNPVQRRAKLNELKQQFAYPLDLRPASDFNWNRYEQTRLEQGLIVRREQDGIDVLYVKAVMPASAPPETAQVWAVTLDQPRQIDEANTAAGTFYLLQQVLSEQPPAAWPATIAYHQSQFGYPLILHQPGTLRLPVAAQQRLDAGEIAVVLHDQYSETDYQQVVGSDYVLQMGPFETPFIGRYLNVLVGGIFTLLLIVASYFWLWPLWRHLMQIKKAAEAFGNGQYDTRVPYHKRSRLAELTQAFNAMAERTQNSIRSHKELTSAVSHELRTPVARMRFALEMLATSDDAADHQRYVATMNRDIDELNDLLAELLTYARFDAANKPLIKQQESIATWFTGTMQSLERLADGKLLTWSNDNISANEIACFSPTLMSRVLNNLVQNALRYARNRVMVSLSKTADEYMLQVEDDGPGIPKQAHERLFEAFATLDDSRNKESAGFGLGLAIVQRIVEGHHGTVIIADRQAGSGTCFIVRWPLQSDRTPGAS